MHCNALHTQTQGRAAALSLASLSPTLWACACACGRAHRATSPERARSRSARSALARPPCHAPAALRSVLSSAHPRHPRTQAGHPPGTYLQVDKARDTIPRARRGGGGRGHACAPRGLGARGAALQVASFERPTRPTEKPLLSPQSCDRCDVMRGGGFLRPLFSKMRLPGSAPRATDRLKNRRCRSRAIDVMWWDGMGWDGMSQSHERRRMAFISKHVWQCPRDPGRFRSSTRGARRRERPAARRRGLFSLASSCDGRACVTHPWWGLRFRAPRHSRARWRPRTAQRQSAGQSSSRCAI